MEISGKRWAAADHFAAVEDSRSKVPL